jgi:hypothetical protein
LISSCGYITWLVFWVQLVTHYMPMSFQALMCILIYTCMRICICMCICARMLIRNLWERGGAATGASSQRRLCRRGQLSWQGVICSWFPRKYVVICSWFPRKHVVICSWCPGKYVVICSWFPRKYVVLFLVP